MKLTARQRYILSFCHGRFCRVESRNDFRWRFIRSYEYQRPAIENLPSERETKKLIDAGLVELVVDASLGKSTVDGVEYPMRSIVLTDAGRAALAAEPA